MSGPRWKRFPESKPAPAGKMRILYFSQSYTVHDRRFLLKLAHSRHEVWFLPLEDGARRSRSGPLPAKVRLAGLPGPPSSAAQTPATWLGLMPRFEALIHELKPDLIHAGPVTPCGFMTALAGFHPWLLMSWGSDILLETEQDDLWHWITRYTLGSADMLACDCEAVKDRARALVDYPAEGIVQFPWGIDLPRFTPGVPASPLKVPLGWDGAFVLISTRSWEHVYGIPVLLEAFRLAHGHRPRLRLLLLGDGSLAPEVHRRITNDGLAAAIHCPGTVSQELLPDYFRSADLYVSCSFSDGTSISLLEALASALPVAVTDIPANREWVTPGENGWLVPPGDAEALAGCLLQAMDWPGDLRREMSRANRLLAEERADWEVNSEKLLEAYERLERQYARRTP